MGYEEVEPDHSRLHRSHAIASVAASREVHSPYHDK
jgi:hypothetical protein